MKKTRDELDEDLKLLLDGNNSQAGRIEILLIQIVRLLKGIKNK